MKTLLVYYSRRGIARRIVNDLGQSDNVDVIEIKVKKNYRGYFGYFKSRHDALTNSLPEITYDNFNVKDYDRIIIVGAVWSKSICSPIMTFLNEFRGKLKNVEYIVITKNEITNFSPIFSAMDYSLKTHFNRATAITVKFNRIVNIKRY